MQVAYFDLISGASGDMLLGALVDAGLLFADLERTLGGLHLPGFRLESSRVMRGAFSATKVDVVVTDNASVRHLPQIEALIQAGDLSEHVRERALRIFRRMVEAEAKIHNQDVNRVHLHELGGHDTIVDVVGVLSAIELLKVDQVVVSPFPLGRGRLEGAHGSMPLPAPATMALLQGAPLTGVDHAYETVTPTAAAVLTEVASSFGVIPRIRLAAVGYGAGSRKEPEPNVLRVLLGQGEDAGGVEVGTLDLLETNVDDMNPEFYGYVIERLFEQGARDAYLTPIVMKKSRPGIVLSVLCLPEDTNRLRAILFSETTTLGVRTQQVTRHALPFSIETVETPYGPLRVKVGCFQEGQRRAAPEFEDCRVAALKHRVPLSIVYNAARDAWALIAHCGSGNHNDIHRGRM